MLEALRKGTASWIAKIFIGILVLSFAVWGVADIFGGYGAQTVATVGDVEISSQEYQSEFQREVQALSRSQGRNVTYQDASAMGLDNQVLVRLIGDAALENDAKALGLGITGKAVVAWVEREDVFKDTSGKFSQEQFYRVLLANGLSEEAFLVRQRRALVLQQLTGTVSETGQVPQTLLQAVNRYRNETRKLSYFSVPLGELGTVGEPTAEQVRAYYNTHKSEFRAPEFRKVGILVLTPQSLMAKIEVGDNDLKAYFENNRNRFGSPERRAVQQIAFPDEATANAAYEKLQGGAGFMDIAKSRDLSKEDVDLGLIPKSGIADEKVAEAVFALPVGEISKPIKGSLATVIAKVTKIEPADVKTFEDVRDTIRTMLQSERAARQILDVYDKIEDERAAGSTLAEITRKLDLIYSEIAAVDRRGRDADGKPVEPLAREPNLMRAVFDAEVGLETDPEETTDRGFVWYDVLEITPERLRDFDEVKEEAAKKWRETEERALLAAKGQGLVDKARSGESLAALASSFDAEVEQTGPIKRNANPPGLPRAAVQQAFALKQGGVGSATSADGKARIVFQVTETNVPDRLDAKTREDLTQAAARGISDDLIVQYVRALRDKYSVNVNQTIFQEATAGRLYSGSGGGRVPSY